MSKLSTNVIVAVSAFLIGFASASAFNKFNADEQIHAVPSAHSDAMGNVRNTQD
ncbi:hypothetical protein [Polynucleobacter necessarius]|uniref:hypothetical protein n=1 Tax=Polynucleobacter necessarius TaxID=576610 RepID=UPI0013B0619F|nr:hypothetical protein [Polynucleobacter necessarius]